MRILLLAKVNSNLLHFLRQRAATKFVFTVKAENLPDNSC